MKIKHENGMVTFVMRTGKDLVRSKMTIGTAYGIVNHGKDVSEKDGQIIVDDKYFIPVDTSPDEQTEGDAE
jgi:hypothetical protein